MGEQRGELVAFGNRGRALLRGCLLAALLVPVGLPARAQGCIAWPGEPSPLPRLDDPAYFGGYMNDNFLACTHALALGREELRQLAENAIDASFATDARKTELRRELDAWFKRAD